MQKTLKKALSFALVLVMVLGIIPMAALADEVQLADSAALPVAMDGLSIAYPYNTENIQLTQTPVSRFDALTFESARNEVESAQMILTPTQFDVDYFELTMNSLYNENGNIIPAYAFDVFIQHYVTVKGSTNAPQYDKFETHDSWLLNKQYSDYVFHPRDGGGSLDGTFPDALIPQENAIAAGENKIAKGNNGGIWVNLNVHNAAPGTYTGTATLNVNGTDMEIPVSVRIYDVKISDEVHSIVSAGVSWDMMGVAETGSSSDNAKLYYEYLLSKRVSPWSNYGNWYDSANLAQYAADRMAGDSSVSAYLLYCEYSGRTVVRDSVVKTLTDLINKNLELANAGSDLDLFEKAYFYFTCVDEPASNNVTYKQAQAAIDVLDSVKEELAPMLDAYPSLKESFLAIGNIVTGANPADRTWHIDGCLELCDHSALTSKYNSVIYTPQFHYMQTAEERALYANDAEVWWYGCCHPIAPYPTFHLNTALVNNRALGFMMYEYDIDGMLYSDVAKYGTYEGATIDTIKLYDFWNGYNGTYTPGDMMLIYPGSDYGVSGPIGSVRLETIREGSEDYEYLWLLENEFGISNISAYTTGLYDGAIVTGVYDGQKVDPDGDGNTDASALYHTRRTALLSELEERNIAQNGATEIAPGEEGFVRGDRFEANVGLTKYLSNNVDGVITPAATISFEYKLDAEANGNKDKIMSLILRRGSEGNWVNDYQSFTFAYGGTRYNYENVTCKTLEDGYIRVTIDMTGYEYNDYSILDFYDWSTVGGYIDNIQWAEAPENHGTAFAAGEGVNLRFDNAVYDSISFDYKLLGEGSMTLILRDEDNWTTKVYGDYTFNATGLSYNYGNYQSGITCEVLEDGYVHVTMKLSELQRSGLDDNRDAAPEKIGVLDIYSWTNVDGYIDNLQLVKGCEHSYDAVETAPTFSADGYTTYTCSICGNSYVENGEAAYEFGVKTWNIALCDDIRANFHLNIDSRLTDAAVTVLVGGSGYKYSVSELATTDEGYYVVSANVAAAQMTEEISIEISSGELSSEQKTYTIRQYAEYILAGEYDENTKLLVQRMLNYGAAAQTYFTYNTGNMANSGYEMTDVPVIPEAEDGSVASGDVVGIDYYGASLLYETKVGVRFYYTVTGEIENYTFTDAQGNEYEPVAKSGMYYVEVMNINPNQYDDAIEMLVTDGNNTQSVSYSPMRYISRKYYGSTDTKLVSLVTQMYQYHLAAEKFLNEDQPRGDRFEANVGITKYLSNKVDGVITPAGIISFEYKLDAEADGDKSKTLSLILRRGSDGNWTNSYQTFTFAYNGARYTYDNVTCEVLEDGYIRVTIDMTGYEYNDYHVLDFYDWSTVGGYVDNIQWSEPPVKMRGDRFEANVGITKYLSNKVDGVITPAGTISFEYKLDEEADGDKTKTLSLILRRGSDGNWTNSYQSFTFAYNGARYTYDNVTCEVLEDGYIRVTIDMTGYEYNDYHVLDFYDWSTVGGYVDNIQWTEAPVKMRGERFEAGVTLTKYLSNINGDEITPAGTISFDYKLDDIAAGDKNQKMTLILRRASSGNWTNNYQEYTFVYEGVRYNPANVTCETLDDGYIHVVIDLTGLEYDDYGVLDFYKWSTVGGYVDNIQWTEKTEEPDAPVIRGTAFQAGASANNEGFETAAYSTIVFDYKLDGEGTLDIRLRSSSYNYYYGQFSFNANGEVSDYAGVTTEKLADGYIRVTIKTDEVTTHTSTKPTDTANIQIYKTTTVGGYLEIIELIEA